MRKKTLSVLLIAVTLLTLFTGCGKAAETPAPAATETPAVQTQAPAETPEASGAKVASSEDMTDVVEVVEDGMTPVFAESLKDGRYPVEMKSSSSMFKVESCELIVADGAMQAVLYMTSEAYPYMFADTAEAAAAADEADYIPLTENEDGTKSFTLPVDALDAGVSCAAFSKRKELWYDRTLLFRSDSLPLEAFADGAFTTVESLGLADGSYTVSVALAGGSGRASVESPAMLTVKDGAATVRLVWGSSNYDYMKVDDVQYLPLQTEGNSTFEIPIAVFDRKLPVLADTTAMSQPYEIAYTLSFDSASIQPAA
ncbi:MAG: hypothetical protein IJ594_10315 [Oscillospiraceae bacterium]|nr:hypothetical protein [Oscillospiraceae bacterium]